jgi:hypothetical protein
MNWSLIPNNCEPKPVFICLLQRVANITAIILFHPSNSPQFCMNNGIDGYAELLPSGSYTAHNNWDLLLLRTIAETINARTVPMSYFARFVVPINCHRISSSFFVHSSSSSCSRATFFIPRIIDGDFHDNQFILFRRTLNCKFFSGFARSSLQNMEIVTDLPTKI